MKIDDKAWRQIEAVNHVLNNSNWKETKHHYLTAEQIEEILTEMYNELRSVYQRNQMIDSFRKRK